MPRLRRALRRECLRRLLVAGFLSLLLGLVGNGTSTAMAPAPRPLVPAPAPGPAEPAPSPDGSDVAFAWGGDLWVVPSDGGPATRLTEGPAEDSRPVWSPDGGGIAFSRREDERRDIWFLDLKGRGELRLTRHDAPEYPSGFSPDGTYVLFHGARDDVERVYRVPATGGPIEPIVPGPSSGAILRADGTLFYQAGEHPWWRRGGRGPGGGDVWMRSPSGKTTRLTEFPGPDLWPGLSADGRTVYFVSEESFQRNVWQLDLVTKERAQITGHREDPVSFPQVSVNGRLLVYEQSGRVWKLDPTDGTVAPEQIRIELPALPDERIERNSGGGASGLAVRGGWLWLDIRGDVFVATVPGSQAPGDTLELDPVDATGFLEFGAVPFPEGSSAIVVSDRTGTRDLYRGQGSDGPNAVLDPFRANRSELESPVISPDGRFVAYVRRFDGAQLRLAEADGGRDLEIARAVSISDPEFSPDGRWIAFAGEDESGNADIFIVSLFGSGLYNVTLHPARDRLPHWSPDGGWLYFLSDRAGSFDVWGVPLQASGHGARPHEPGRSGSADPTPNRNPTPTPNPTPNPDAAGNPNADPDASADPNANAGPDPGPDPDGAFLGIDLSGIALRSVQLTRLFGDEREFFVTADGRLAFLSPLLGRDELFLLPDIAAEPVRRTTSTGIRAATLSDGYFWFLDDAGGLYRLRDANGEVPESVPFRAQVSHDPVEERLQVLREVWTGLRDGFYQETLHLANWSAVGERAEERLRGVRTRSELERLLLEMSGELNASHLGVATPPPRPAQGRWGLSTSGEAGRLRVIDVLPGGPADEVGIVTGDLLFSVAGVPVDASRALEVAVPVLPGAEATMVWIDADGEERRGTTRAVDGERIRALRFSERERQRRARVSRASDGRFAYVALPTVDRVSLDRLRRETELLQPRSLGLILDLRDNVGGDLPEEFLRQLDRSPLLLRQPRGQSRRGAPAGLFDRPIVVIVGPGTGSAAEIVAHGLREAGRAELVGEPTLGSVIGADELELQLGLRFRIPRVGWYTLQGENLEGRGVTPDVWVTAASGDGDDPALERALQVMEKRIRGK